MKESYTSKRRVRRSFGKIDAVSDMPSLIEVQTGSYASFIEQDKNAEPCEFGLEEVFKSIFPIKDFSGNGELEFVKYELEEPKYDVDECIKRDMTYAAPVKATLRLVVWDTDEATGAKSIHDIKEQDVYMGDIPLMTDKGTFIFNGTERVVVSQMHRSPGVFFDHDKGKTVASGKYLFAARVIPYRGSWLDFEFDAKDLVYARIDRRRKLPVTSILYSLYSKETEEKIKQLAKDGKKIDRSEVKGMDKEEILNYFYDADTYVADKKNWKAKFVPERMKGVKFDFDLVNAKTGDVVLERGKKLTPRSAQKLADEGLEFYSVSKEQMYGKFLANNVVDGKTGEVVAEAGAELNEELLDKIAKAKIGEIRTLFIDGVNVGPYIRNTLEADKNNCREEALLDIYRVMRPGEPPTYETADQLFKGLFFDIERYDLSSVGRVKMNVALDISFDDAPDTYRTLRKDDILRIVKRLVELRDGKGEVDDIDHLGNRRVRSVGELMENQYRMGLLRMERAIRERMSSEVLNNVKPQDLVNAKPIASVIREFFGSSQLSQFMDQNNPLSEITHKRRLSALGPGGLSRERAGFEVRDVHPTHYGRICPIETPEGPNIGLINSLSTYARINKYGFIECPYRKVVNGVVTKEVVYLSANEEGKFKIAEANAKVKEDGHFENDLIACRKAGEFEFAHPEEIDFIDVSPQQLVSVATALIPFLENDDANRALMGANMQRQAVPLMVTEAPIVATGIEHKLCVDSGVVILAEDDGLVMAVSADSVKVRYDSGEIKDYKLIKFARSNQGTCINQRPIVAVGDRLSKGDVIADGPATSQGEIALGKNLLVGFMTWEGYNYEDAVLINERLVMEDVYTSIHIEEFECDARDTKLGPEEITRDIPGVGDDALKYLDDRGIICVGAEVRSGDILVGKVTPKGETDLTAEERLLRAIFGEKAREVRDTSLKVPHGEAGIIVDVKRFTRENGDEMSPGVNEVVRVYIAQKRKISVGDKMAGRHGNKGVVSRILPREDMPYLPDGTPLDIVLNPLGVPSRMNIGQMLEVHLGYAAQALGWKVATPVFNGANEETIRETLNKAGLREDGKSVLYDGRTGQKFDNDVTVGWVYFLKLHHLVDDKIHARSTGPYSLVTQQPLGGKAQFGGQRFGEMEVWALEAYGAAYTLQEILTVKSDDVTGRVRTYEAIVKGENIPQPGVPESFKVLIKELQSLCLDVRILDENGDEIELKDDEDDYIPGMRDEMSYKSDDDEITGSGFTIEDVPVEEDNSLGAFGDAGDDDDYTDDSDKEEE